MRLHLLTPLALALVACEPAPALPDVPIMPLDGGPDDVVAPSVTETTPEDGASEAVRSAPLVVRFSEPMAVDRGTIEITPGPVRIRAEGADWNPAGNTLTVALPAPLPAGEVTVHLGDDFTDRAGNALTEHTWSFFTEDDVSPRVTASSPAEGETDVSARLDAISITFDEPMRTTVGTIDVLGGAATLSGSSWSADAATVTFGLADLEYERDYQVVLRGFLDASGNRFDDEAYLGDGLIDFSTGTDGDAPRVVRSEPAEGQLDVNPADTTTILVTFDEPMSPTDRTVVLSDGTSDVELTGTWVSSTLLRVGVAGELAFGIAYTLDLSALEDRAGNALDADAYLLDGALDFTTGDDAFAPFVRASTPIEGERDVPYADPEPVVLSFSEAMDTTATSVPVAVGAAAPTSAPLTWTSPTEATVAVAGLLGAGAAIRIDARALLDTTGNPLDAVHDYLGDGQLDFFTGAPSGEGCLDPLTAAEGTVEGSVTRWSITSLAGAVRDGGTARCDSNGTTANGTDVVVRFDKTTGTVAAGGSLLRITVDAASSATGSNPFDVAVSTAPTCDPAAVPLQCRANAGFHEITVDAAAGPVWVWLARSTSSTTSVAATVSIEEIAPPPREGDSCAAPFTSASAIYTAPSAPGMPHRFAIPENSSRGADMMGPTSHGVPNAFSCDTSAGQGIDSVIRFDKPDDASVLRVHAARVATSGDSFDVGVYDACDAVAPSTDELACRTGVTASTTADFLVDAPAGPVYVWVGDTLTTVSRTGSNWIYHPAIDVTVEVIPDVADGEICSRGLPLAAGANTVVGTSDLALERPSCFAATANVEWYRLRTSADVTFVTPDAPGAVAMVLAEGRRELTCVADAAARPITRVLPVGTEVCIAVEMGRGIGALSVTGQAYSGLGSNAPVELGILRPFTATATAEESVTSDYWMLATPEHLVMRHTSSAVMDVSRSGGERAVRRGADDGVTSTMLGRTAVEAGGAIFSFGTSTTAASSRVTRLWDGRSLFWTPVAWDPGATYVTQSIMASAADGDGNFWYVTDSATTTTFYRLSASAPGTPTVLGTSTQVVSVRGMTMDDEFVYLQASVGGARGVYRLPRTNLAASPTTLAVSTAFSTSTTQATAMALDDPETPAYLYVRDGNGEVQVIIDPAGAAPFYLGPVIDLGTSSDWAMTIAHDTGALYLFETETVSTGNWVRYDP